MHGSYNQGDNIMRIGNRSQVSNDSPDRSHYHEQNRGQVHYNDSYNPNMTGHNNVSQHQNNYSQHQVHSINQGHQNEHFMSNNAMDRSTNQQNYQQPHDNNIMRIGGNYSPDRGNQVDPRFMSNDSNMGHYGQNNQHETELARLRNDDVADPYQPWQGDKSEIAVGQNRGSSGWLKGSEGAYRDLFVGEVLHIDQEFRKIDYCTFVSAFNVFVLLAIDIMIWIIWARGGTGQMLCEAIVMIFCIAGAAYTVWWCLRAKRALKKQSNAPQDYTTIAFVINLLFCGYMLYQAAEQYLDLPIHYGQLAYDKCAKTKSLESAWSTDRAILIACTVLSIVSCICFLICGEAAWFSHKAKLS